jgi:hypothetical protein
MKYLKDVRSWATGRESRDLIALASHLVLGA